MGKQQQVQGRSCRYGSERLLYPVVHQVSSGSGADQLADLDEEDVWSVLDCSTRSSSNTNTLLQPELQEHRRGGRRVTAGGLSLAFEAAAGTRHQQQQQHQNVVGGAAPLKVPAKQWLLGGRSSFPSSSCREEEEAADWVAPHEYLQHARRGSSSVFEGVGRTLKGRDLSRVRDAVWSNTGFLG
ncbi:uncharacterized protein LOC100839665 [Brachypodium distachyon]|uniref:Senescence regulator n=1 Tax=Brachypodium distachyon TaxID=15368 RepID=I1H4I5_BRADI|nr:uncharacterized protein LOC100839665 [Brachypodium distachyon]KQK21255.1 hypothetical protein BRADI_1g59720v3 [Brachypodium distachyon]|eukprot:XP_003561535.1 uncharacterized protein LOC100839665 [Brachypodium distachyon]